LISRGSFKYEFKVKLSNELEKFGKKLMFINNIKRIADRISVHSIEFAFRRAVNKATIET